jgi:hypothetical protein
VPENEYEKDDAVDSCTPLIYHVYVSVPVPPDTVDEKVTELPVSVGFWLDDIDTDGFGFIVTVTDDEYVSPTASVTVTVKVYVPAVENEYEKSCDVEITLPFKVHEYVYGDVPPLGDDENSIG